MTEEYRGYRIESDPVYSHKVIKSLKGKLPNNLLGYFTNITFARNAIDQYVGPKEAVDAPSETTT